MSWLNGPLVTDQLWNMWTYQIVRNWNYYLINQEVIKRGWEWSKDLQERVVFFYHLQSSSTPLDTDKTWVVVSIFLICDLVWGSCICTHLSALYIIMKPEHLWVRLCSMQSNYVAICNRLCHYGSEMDVVLCDFL